ncbi:MAG: response regulator [Planctomycetales bacterium]|nr:response regulator [Planctomycetales bacterium]
MSLEIESRARAPEGAGPRHDGASADALDLRLLLQVLTAARRGDFSARLPLEYSGLARSIAEALNDILERSQRFTDELERVSEAVGKQGRFQQRVTLESARGSWAARVESVNGLIEDLVRPSTEMARVIGAVARGDLSQTVPHEIEGRRLKGEFLRTARIVNGMVTQLESFASEVTRVAREVGTEGKLGGQAEVKGVAGTWKDLTDSVNSMARNLTSQVRNIADVTTAVARGDLSRKITVDAKGEILELKETINTMVDQLGSFASEVTRVAGEVGTEGRLGGQAVVKGVAGTWKDLTENVNSMARNLTSQVRNIADVTTAVARGDLSKKITVDVRGEIAELAETINSMTDTLATFAEQVTSVAREVGVEGKLGGQAAVKGVAGTWKDLTDNVNSMAQNLTSQVRNIADVTTAVARGDLSKKITVDVRGEILALKNTINTMVDQLGSFASEVTRVAREVGTEGKLGGQAVVKGVAGTWKDLTDNVNSMAQNLTSQVRNIAEVTTAVARGDLSRKITVDVRGEILELKDTINTMVDQLGSFASEVTRVAGEVGTEGKLGGQAQVKGVAGTWKDLTDNVNSMARNLTTQVRGIAQVVTAVAQGDMKRKLVLEARGEIAALAETINAMTDTLAVFADQVTTVAREVGVDGKLGGQARVPGAAGTWRELTDNVNQLAANLTTQVRAIAEVATAVTAGDLSRSITVGAQGEVAALKDNINAMIRNLRDTTMKNTEQDWLNTNLAKFGRMLQGQRDLAHVCRRILSELAPLVEAQHGAFYITEPAGDGSTLALAAEYASVGRGASPARIAFGEGLVGQCALDRKRILLTDVPADYVRVRSGLGEAPVASLVVLPVLFEGNTKGVLELASFRRFSDVNLVFLEQLAETIGVVLNTIAANMTTEQLLQQSQALTEQLQSRQSELTETNMRLEQQARTLGESQELLHNQREELQKTNADLQEKARLLLEQKSEVERARRALEEKARQLELTSRYKSEFLSNMSHELRTPLNSLLILSQVLGENSEGNLHPKQVEYARTIHSSGTDLLDLINDILDLSKIESGTVVLNVGRLSLTELRDHFERTFRPMAEARGLAFGITLADRLPEALQTDAKRLQQILKNLLSNAFKFTEAGRVDLRIFPAREGWSPGHETLGRSGEVVGFSVTDTGIGVPEDKQQIIFEAFQQVDGTTSRRYGGTGLGLSISRQNAKLLGGEIRLESQLGEGSTFTLFVPAIYTGAPKVRWTAGAPVAAAPAPAVETAVLAGALSSAPAARPGAGADDRESLRPGDWVLLVVEDDPAFASALLDLGREAGFKGVVAGTAAEAIEMVERTRPSAITLDLRLPDADGRTVLRRVTDDPATRHIPVQIVSVDETAGDDGISLGALAVLKKPAPKEALVEALDGLREFVERRARKLLVVEDDPVQRRAIVEAFDPSDVAVTEAATGAEAIEAMRRAHFDGMVLDLKLPDISGSDLIRKIHSELGFRAPPVVVHTAKTLAEEEERELRAATQAIVTKDPRFPDRLRQETAWFLQRVKEDLPRPIRRALGEPGRPDPALSGKKILIVDDDLRNIFALTAVLGRFQMQVAYAARGAEGIAVLQKMPDIHVVLMDIMMPEMDGYETIRAIRSDARFRDLPIIALTAKAMKGDREKCLEAGASDYISKPVDLHRLLSMLRLWLSK